MHGFRGRIAPLLCPVHFLTDRQELSAVPEPAQPQERVAGMRWMRLCESTRYLPPSVEPDEYDH
jgi:hypothetical protein